MGRRFRLSVHRKNEFRKNLQRTVIAEHVCTVTVSSNSVSSSNLNGLSSEVLQCDNHLTLNGVFKLNFRQVIHPFLICVQNRSVRWQYLSPLKYLRIVM